MIPVKSKTAYKTVRKTSKLKDCPYCKSELTETEKDFFPCSCTFQACVDCYKDIMRNKAVCPSCHTHLKLEQINALHVSKREELSKPDIDKLQAKKTEKKSTTTTVVTIVSTKSNGHVSQTTSSIHSHEESSRAALNKMSFTEQAKLRVIQKTMVYVIGLAPQVAKTDILEKYEYFGQYGKITKIIVNKSNVYNAHGPGGPSYSAYVTYSNDVEASTAILAIDEFTTYDRIMRASYGTTKYCTFFLRGKPCPNSGCLYLHTVGKDSFLKDDSISNKDIFNDQQRLALEHIQKHYQEMLRKINVGAKQKTVFPSVKTIQTKVQDFIAENEAQKESLNSKEVERTPEKSVKSLKATATASSEERANAENTSNIKEGVVSKDNSIGSDEKENSVADENRTVEEEKAVQPVGSDTKGSKEEEKISLVKGKPKGEGVPPLIEKDNIINQGDMNCQSHRSSSSNYSTTANSVKKEVAVDQKEETDSRVSLKSPDSSNNENEANGKQAENVSEAPNVEEAKGDINLVFLLEKIDVRESNGSDGYQDEFDRKIIKQLLGSLSSQSSSRFKLILDDDKDEADEPNLSESGREDWENKNEEFSLISKSIQEYLLSPTASTGANTTSENSQAAINPEDSSFFPSSKYLINNCPSFSTPTKKSNLAANNSMKIQGSDSNGGDSSNNPAYKSEDFDGRKLSDKTGSNGTDEDSQNAKTGKSKGNKKQNKANGKAANPAGGKSTDKNGATSRVNSSVNENSNSKSDKGSYNNNINMHMTDAFNISKNTTHNLIQSTL